MHSNTLDFMLHKETAPTVMHGLAVWKKFKVPFYFSSNNIVSAMLYPNPFLSAGRVETFQNSSKV